MKNSYCFILFFTLNLFTFTFSQTNYSCQTAKELICGTTSINGTTVGATESNIANNCASKFGAWYYFEGDGSVTNI